MSCKVKVPAKINFTLDITGVENGYHNIESLVASVDLYDVISVSKRNDYNISLTEKNILTGCKVEDNNAVKAAELFSDTFNTLGVDIVIEKNIPIANGLGGSSADIAGVLLAMKKLFKIEGSILPLANKLGSDSGYMVYGGFAVLKGKGDIVERVDSKIKPYILLLFGEEQVLAKDCYLGYDKLAEKPKRQTAKAVDGLICGDYNYFCDHLSNALYLSAKEIAPNLEKRINDLINAGAKKALMTGSGSCVYGVFKTKKEMKLAYEKLRDKYKDKLFMTRAF